MRRWLFNFAAAMSLLLLLATTALWLRARWTWTQEGLFYRSLADARYRCVTYAVANTPFGVGMRVSQSNDYPGTGGRWEHWTYEWFDDDGSGIGSQYISEGGGGAAGFWWSSGGWHRAVFVPHWAPALLASTLPAAWAVGWWRRRRAVAAGRCRQCGYDLRATPARCPECGAAPAAAAIPS